MGVENPEMAEDAQRDLRLFRQRSGGLCGRRRSPVEKTAGNGWRARNHGIRMKMAASLLLSFYPPTPKGGAMTPRELRARRIALGWTPGDLAGVLGVNIDN